MAHKTESKPQVWRVIVKRRLTSAAVAGILATAALVGTSGAAEAHIVWTNGTFLVNHKTGQCLDFNGMTVIMNSCLTDGDPNGYQAWEMVSAAPDTGYANVQIKPVRHENWCLENLNAAQFPGPLAGSSQVRLDYCDATNPAQIWAMTTAEPRTDNGWTAHLNLFTFGGRDCLDGGIGAYGFREEGCNRSNPYQEWDFWHWQSNDDGSRI